VGREGVVLVVGPQQLGAGGRWARMKRHKKMTEQDHFAYDAGRGRHHVTKT